MKNLLLFLVLAACAHKVPSPQDKLKAVGIDPEEKFYLLFADRMECGVTTVNGIDLSPRAMMTAYPSCQMEIKSGDDIELYILDCTKDSQIGNVLIYTKDIESCLRTKYILEQLKGHSLMQNEVKL